MSELSSWKLLNNTFIKNGTIIMVNCNSVRFKTGNNKTQLLKRPYTHIVGASRWMLAGRGACPRGLARNARIRDWERWNE
jgi:hypothetical protein